MQVWPRGLTKADYCTVFIHSWKRVSNAIIKTFNTAASMQALITCKLCLKERQSKNVAFYTIQKHESQTTGKQSTFQTA